MKLSSTRIYGKLASSTVSSYKIAYVTEDGDRLAFYQVDAHDKQAGYIACGSAITSYARNFTITAAQNNYYGIDKDREPQRYQAVLDTNLIPMILHVTVQHMIQTHLRYAIMTVFLPLKAE